MDGTEVTHPKFVSKPKSMHWEREFFDGKAVIPEFNHNSTLSPNKHAHCNDNLFLVLFTRGKKIWGGSQKKGLSPDLVADFYEGHISKGS